MIKQILAGAMVFGLLNMTSCGSGSKNAADYNNSIITVINGSEAHITAMNSAMTSADYDKAEQVRMEWEKSLEQDIKKIDGLGDFNGDANFQKAVLDGLKGYQKIVTESYPKLIDIRKNNKADEATENTLLNDINTAFENMSNGVNKASDDFEEKYNK